MVAFMTDTITDLTGERMIRRAPDHPLPLSADDRAYLLSCLEEVERVFGIRALPEVQLTVLPGRTLMRRLIDLRRTLRARDAEQRTAFGRLAGAISLVDTACGLDHDLHQS